MACPAGTVYRNYFHPLTIRSPASGKDRTIAGQSAAHQINCLEAAERELGAQSQPYWTLKNGYCFPTSGDALRALCDCLTQNKDMIAARFRDAVQVGVHWNTQVFTQKHSVAQVYCSALPIAYARGLRAKTDDWAPFAQAVLDSIYDSSFAVATYMARRRNARVRLYLTAVGGGVFGNRHEWICDAIKSACNTYQHENIDVHLVHFRAVAKEYEGLLPTITK